MKAILTFFLVFIAGMIFTNAFCQTYLTYGQVYDFNVGDIIQARGVSGTFGASSPHTYETKTILSKTYSKDKDTIVYIIKQENYTVRRCPDCKPVSSIYTNSFMVTNLESTPMYNLSSCGSRDTMYTGYGDLLVHESLPIQDTTCEVFEGVDHRVEYIQGVGGPYYTMFDAQGPAYWEYKLVYYKNHSGSWGSFFKPVREEPFFKDYTWNDLEILRTTCFTGNCNGGSYYTTHSYHLGKDTLLAGKNYNVLIDSLYANNIIQNDTIGFIREEMGGKKIYFLSKNHYKEFLLYDFTLQVGDEFTNSRTLNPIIYKVTSVDSVDYMGINRMTITMSSNQTRTMVWIEGVGAEQGFMYCNYYESLLLCLKDHQKLLYRNTENYDCIKTGYIDAVNNIQAQNTIRIYPNPASNFVTIESKDLIKTVVLMDRIGNKIYQDQPNAATIRLSLANFKKGIYLLEVNHQKMKLIIK